MLEMEMLQVHRMSFMFTDPEVIYIIPVILVREVVVAASCMP